MLDGLLYELRMAYVERARAVERERGPLRLGLLALAAAPPRSAPAAPTPPARPPRAPRSRRSGRPTSRPTPPGDAGRGEARALREIRRARIERNVQSLDSVALALVAQGSGQAAGGERDERRAGFRDRRGPRPRPAGRPLGLALALLQQGPARLRRRAVDATLAGVPAFLATRARLASARDLLTLGGAPGLVRRGVGDRRRAPVPPRRPAAATTSRSRWARRTTAPPRSRCFAAAAAAARRDLPGLGLAPAVVAGAALRRT